MLRTIVTTCVVSGKLQHRNGGNSSALSINVRLHKFICVFATGSVCQQVAVDATAGTLSDPRQRFLGTKPVKLFRIRVQDKRGVSNRGPKIPSFTGNFHSFFIRSKKPGIFAYILFDAVPPSLPQTSNLQRRHTICGEFRRRLCVPQRVRGTLTVVNARIDILQR